MLRATFGFTDAQGEDVREMAVFFYTQARPECPPASATAPPDIARSGQIYTLERRTAVYRMEPPAR